MAREGLYYTLLYVGVLIVFYYLFILVPGKKRKREHDEMQRRVKTGDRVVTIGGVNGRQPHRNPPRRRADDLPIIPASRKRRAEKKLKAVNARERRRLIRG